jgi:outer membrane protein assembly factor BamB
LLAVRATTGEILWSNAPAASHLFSVAAGGGRIYLTALDEQSLNVYNSKDGSFLQNVKGSVGALEVDGVSYYIAQSGMVQ